MSGSHPLARPCTGALVLGLLTGAAALPASAQTVRLTGASTVRYVSARALVEDSVALDSTSGAGLLRYTASGQPVRCIEGAPFCRYFTAGDVLSAVPFTQDVNIAAWGIGRGIRLQAALRARMPLGGDEALWPRADDRFDALEAYLEIARPIGRIRLGRQWQSSGLGTYGYDGASMLYTHRGLAIEAFGGWSLVRGLAEPITDDALAAIEPFAPDARGILLGSRVQARGPGIGATLGYQREIRSDRLGLYSERATASGYLRRGIFNFDASADADVATRALNHLRVQAAAQLLPVLGVELYGRRYRPYFDLWTIWGAFAPVGFDELGGALRYTPVQRPLAFDLRAARRSYGDTETALAFAPQRRDGWRLDAAAQATLSPAWSAHARYAADVGHGAARSQVDVRVQRELSANTFVGLEGTVFERGSEFQLTDGLVIGGGLDAGWKLDARTRALGHIVAYRHLPDTEVPGVDWTQVRAQLRLEWTLGPDPGLERIRPARRP